ncbi:hypothetical protein CoNPh26_CDS0120 [Staphylococcus phage S-CoN_Ph26]|nr:hypothetical protein CoNPh26_CDS0120 [Staphylococcus phage S-CoN_Ph26]
MIDPYKGLTAYKTNVNADINSLINENYLV